MLLEPEDHAMDDRGLDLEKTPKLTEASHTGVKAELSEAELANVTGGGDAAPKASSSLALHCCTGKHIATGKITV
jgi:bacteriocin-like protein